ncbi:MAG: TIM barrel protein [Pirellula sp.]
MRSHSSIARSFKKCLATCSFAVAMLFPVSTVLGQSPGLFAKENLVAWCIVPFDGSKRTPEDRARMLRELGIRRFAYDYRAEHVPTFDREIVALKKNGIELFAWWFPTTLNSEAKLILQTLKQHDVHPQLWVTGGGGDAKLGPEESEKLFQAEVARIRAIALAAQDVGYKVGLYNHGGWFGKPENQIELVRRIHLPNVGVVFNLHHAHDQLDNLASVLQMLKPYLYAVNLNGMETNGDKIGKKILPIGQGNRDKEVLEIIARSGYDGPIGILNHTDEDARKRLEQNMSGLEQLRLR